MTYKGNVDVCPVTKEEWEERAVAKHGECGGQCGEIISQTRYFFIVLNLN